MIRLPHARAGLARPLSWKSDCCHSSMGLFTLLGQSICYFSLGVGIWNQERGLSDSPIVLLVLLAQINFSISSGSRDSLHYLWHALALTEGISHLVVASEFAD